MAMKISTKTNLFSCLGAPILTGAPRPTSTCLLLILFLTHLSVQFLLFYSSYPRYWIESRKFLSTLPMKLKRKKEVLKMSLFTQKLLKLMLKKLKLQVMELLSRYQSRYSGKLKLKHSEKKLSSSQDLKELIKIVNMIMNLKCKFIVDIVILPPVLLLETAPSDTFVQSEFLLSLEPLWSLPGCCPQQRPYGPFVQPGVIHYFMSNLFAVKFPCGWPLPRRGVSLDEANDLSSLLDEGYLRANGRADSVVNHEEVVDVREVIPCQGGEDV